jgi:ACR3 family arsenite transporter
MVAGVARGKLLPDFTATLSKLKFGQGSQVNIPIAVLIWLMIYPMMMLIFAFQAENLTTRWFGVVLIAVPIFIQVYFNSSLTYLLMRRFKVPHHVASPGALIGASNFFELAVAVAITLFGPSSGAALACVVGVLVEVPVMLSVCKICNRTRGWYGGEALPSQ